MSIKAALWLPLVLVTAGCDVPEYSNPPVYPVDHEPRYSPDGTKILFIRGFDDENQCGVWVVDSDGDSERFLVDGVSADWGPDGRMVAVRPTGELSIWIVDADSGSPVKKVCEVAELFGGIDWSPDGRSILYSVAAANGGLSKLDLESGRVTVIAPTYARGARWSANGRRVVYYTTRDGVVIADSEGMDAKVVLRNLSDRGRSYGFRSPCWLGDSVVCQYGYSDGLEAATGLAIAHTCGYWRPLNINGGDPDAHVASGRIVYSAFLPSREIGALYVVESDGSGNRQLTRK